MLISLTKKPLPKKNHIHTSKVTAFLTIGFFLGLLVAFFTQVSEVQAHLYAGLSVLDHKIPVPEYRGPPCDSRPGSDPEFHSLRPYQTSPCGDSDKTYFCWNNYNLLETISNTWDPETCIPNGGAWECEYGEDIEKVYVVDGEYARFPIMGNTEAVTNSQGP